MARAIYVNSCKKDARFFLLFIIREQGLYPQRYQQRNPSGYQQRDWRIIKFDGKDWSQRLLIRCKKCSSGYLLCNKRENNVWVVGLWPMWQNVNDFLYVGVVLSRHINQLFFTISWNIRWMTVEQEPCVPHSGSNKTTSILSSNITPRNLVLYMRTTVLEIASREGSK